jgi:hypothetical protein
MSDIQDDTTLDDIMYPDMIPSLIPNKPVLASSGRPKGSLNKVGQEAKAWSRQFVDDPRWAKMIWFWIDNPEMMPPGVFSTIMFYRYGKPPQTLKVKGEIMARPYLGESAEVLAVRAKQLADRLGKLADPAQRAKLVGPGNPPPPPPDGSVDED